jgi:predicted nucleic acid-binding protein
MRVVVNATPLIARTMGLPVKGTLGILLAAVLTGFLQKSEALDGLHQLADSEIRRRCPLA